MVEELQNLREQIDQVDKNIAFFTRKRIQLVLEVGEVKKEIATGYLSIYTR